MLKLVLIISGIILQILDNTIIPSFSIYGVCPSLLFSFAITYSFLKDKKEAVFIGVLSGFFQDIYFFNGFGVNCLTNMLLCVCASFIGDTIVKNKKTIPVISMAFITMIKFIIIYIIMYFIHIKMNLTIIQMLIISAENAVITFVTYNYLLHRVDKNNSSHQWRLSK